MRLIDADALSKLVGEPIEVFLKRLDLKLPPTVDAVPVIHEKWIRTGRTNIYGGYELECPLCGDKVMVQNIEHELYCRNCGARMDK